jgi:alcohol dehydrogenase
LNPFEYHARTRVIFGVGSVDRIAELARELGFRRPLVVADRGLLEAGLVGRVVAPLATAGIEVVPWHDFNQNPDSAMVEAGRDFAQSLQVDSIVAFGGGSSLDCAKGINFLLTNGGAIADYRGYGKPTRPLLPMIGVPTTAGTGSEAQSYAVISDAVTHEKMACGAPGAAFKIAILDPALTLTTPPDVTAAAGMDAIAHAVETWVTRLRNPLSDLLAHEGWRLLSANYLKVLEEPGEIEARGAMLLGSHLAGAAIEQSMLGATHACANPLTRRYGTAHGVAVAMLLPHVVRWNLPAAADRYAELSSAGGGERRAEALIARLEQFVDAGSFPESLGRAGVAERDLPELAEDAATQWTGTFNPRRFDVAGALDIYVASY